MVRAPCCEKMGVKRGPWTPEEDQLLVAHIQKFGHGNWRALPKQAGLLRCGKSCRLRWTNYLRPDIKRGNFTREEEDTIIKLHQMLGNRWSAIAARLPGRTDNEIKNVWHTHLKKRVKQNQSNPSADNKKQRLRAILRKHEPSSSESKPDSNYSASEITENATHVPVSPGQSSSEVSNGGTEEENDIIVKKEYNDDSWDKLPSVEEDDLWSEFTPMENLTTLEDDFSAPKIESQLPIAATYYNSSNMDDESMNDFWYDLFIKAGDLPELPEF